MISAPLRQTAHDAPDDLTARIAAIWCVILGAARVAPEDNFFALGGTSLSALRVVLQIRGELDVEVPLGVMFDSPTLAALVAAVAALRSTGAGIDDGASPEPDAAAALPCTELTPDRAPRAAAVRRAPASLIQQAHLLITADDGDRGYLSWVYQLNGRLDAPALAAAVDDVVARHDILRTRFERADGRVEQVVAPFAPGVLTVVDLAGRPKLEALDAALAQIQATYQALSPHDDPRLRAFLYVIDRKTSVLAMFVAEVLVDSDGGPLVAAEITRAYAARAGHGAPPALPVPGDVSFLDHVAAHPADPAAVRRARTHWARQLAAVSAAPGWPTALRDRPATCAFQLAPPDWARLVRAIQATGTTAYVFVLASVQVALARLADLSHLLVHATVADRSDPVTEHMIGNFQSPVRLELRVAPADRFNDVVRRTAAAVSEAVTHCAVPPALDDPPGAFPGDAAIPPVRFHMFDYHEGPAFAGVRRRRFRLHSVSRAPLRINCVRGPSGRQDFTLFSATAPDELLAHLAGGIRAVLEAAAADPHAPIAAIDLTAGSAAGSTAAPSEAAELPAEPPTETRMETR